MQRGRRLLRLPRLVRPRLARRHAYDYKSRRDTRDGVQQRLGIKPTNIIRSEEPNENDKRQRVHHCTFHDHLDDAPVLLPMGEYPEYDERGAVHRRGEGHGIEDDSPLLRRDPR